MLCVHDVRKESNAHHTPFLYFFFALLRSLCLLRALSISPRAHRSISEAREHDGKWKKCGSVCLGFIRCLAQKGEKRNTYFKTHRALLRNTIGYLYNNTRVLYIYIWFQTLCTSLFIRYVCSLLLYIYIYITYARTRAFSSTFNSWLDLIWFDLIDERC